MAGTQPGMAVSVDKGAEKDVAPVYHRKYAVPDEYHERKIDRHA